MPDEATHRLIIYMREYGEGEDRAVSGILAKPISMLSLIDKVKRLMAVQGWKLMDAVEKGAGTNPRHKNGRFKKRGE